MGESVYKPLIDGFTWSYSRLTAFDFCNYSWYLHYIYGLKGKLLFFSEYGSFMHSLIEQLLKGELTRDTAVTKYLTGFYDAVTSPPPSTKVFSSYFNGGFEYLNSFSYPLSDILGVEKKVDFSIGGRQFVGFIDYLGRDDDGLCIIDNKARALKPRSKKGNTKSDEELDEYLRQLYIYSAAVEEEYGELPHKLILNSYRTNTVIEEPFNNEAFQNTKLWAVGKINEISNTEKFSPDIEWFKCKYLCDMQNHCEYFQTL